MGGGSRRRGCSWNGGRDRSRPYGAGPRRCPDGDRAAARGHRPRRRHPDRLPRDPTGCPAGDDARLPPGRSVGRHIRRPPRPFQGARRAFPLLTGGKGRLHRDARRRRGLLHWIVRAMTPAVGQPPVTRLRRRPAQDASRRTGGPHFPRRAVRGRRLHRRARPRRRCSGRDRNSRGGMARRVAVRAFRVPERPRTGACHCHRHGRRVRGGGAHSTLAALGRALTGACACDGAFDPGLRRHLGDASSSTRPRLVAKCSSSVRPVQPRPLRKRRHTNTRRSTSSASYPTAPRRSSAATCRCSVASKDWRT